MALQLVTGPSSEPITFDEACAHLKADPTESRDYINGLLSTVREMAEQITGRTLLQKTWRKTLDAFPDAIRLDNPPIIAVTSVKYYDVDGVQQTLSPTSYYVDAESEPGWVVPAPYYCWPVTACEHVNAVEVIYTAGYASADLVPDCVKTWMKVMLRHIYDNPQALAAGNGIIRLDYLDRLLDSASVMRA